MAKNIFQLIIETIFWILIVIFIYQLILKITGHSPTDLTVLYTGFGVIAAHLLTLTYKTGSFSGRVEGFMDNTKESFKRMKWDINNLKNDITDLKKDMLDIKKMLR